MVRWHESVEGRCLLAELNRDLEDSSPWVDAETVLYVSLEPAILATEPGQAQLMGIQYYQMGIGGTCTEAEMMLDSTAVVLTSDDWQ
jgi:hypothetical protein